MSFWRPEFNGRELVITRLRESLRELRRLMMEGTEEEGKRVEDL